MPNPLAWGVLGFIFNFVPYIGALFMELGMFMVGLVTFPSLTYALIAPLCYLALGDFGRTFYHTEHHGPHA